MTASIQLLTEAEAAVSQVRHSDDETKANILKKG